MLFLPVLSRPIPSGGWGRPMTSTERRRLRSLVRWPVSERIRVLRACDSPSRGVLYVPARGGGYDLVTHTVGVEVVS